MNPNIEILIKNWLNQSEFYTLESRYSIPVASPEYIRNPDYLWRNFIIEVNGFFLDKEHQEPIKLHYERVISINKNNSSEQYLEDLQRDLNLLKTTAYAQFEEQLGSYDQPIYTSDPLHMR